MSELTIYNLAKEALRKSNGEVEPAIEALMQQLKSDPQAWLEEIVRIAARQAVHSIISKSREDALRGASETSLAKRALERRQMILDTYSVGGKPLGLATADDLRAQISRLKSQAATLNTHANFLSRILKGMKPGKSVKDCYQADAVERLAREFQLPAAA